MMQTKRTTVTAMEESLRILEAEAERRGISLSMVLREAVEEKAEAVRTRRRPRIGIARSTDGRAARDLTSEPVARPPR
jgi:hypothetical protein